MENIFCLRYNVRGLKLKPPPQRILQLRRVLEDKEGNLSGFSFCVCFTSFPGEFKHTFLVIVHRKGAKSAKVLFFRKQMLKISENPCDFVIEDTSSVKFFSLF
jgi:hypothetical protein